MTHYEEFKLPRNLKELKMEELIGNLLTHELVLNKRNEDTRGKKSLALKVIEDSNSSDEVKDDETAMLSRTFAKINEEEE